MRHDATLEVGLLLVDKVFAGDVDVACEIGARHPVLRQLREGGHLPFPGAFLWTCLRLVRQTREFDAVGILPLPTSHHRVLLGVGDRERRHSLARAAATERWTRVRLIQEAKGPPGVARSAPEKRGRPARSVEAQVAGELAELLARLEHESTGELDGRSERELRELRRQALRLARWADARGRPT